ncbi:DUF485 domain-containing protein [Streptomyces sp. NPDC057445]|uniref:DUF485 domain-containing protein n=1 Tax=Streptomyces sp. NPDC057445 TaxID=3346136 RepID=UPI0036A31492
MSYDPYFPEPPAPPGQNWYAPPPDPVPAPAPHSDLHRLRSGYRRLRRVATFTALGYFVLFLLLSGYAPGLMSSRITGGLTIGLLLGLLTLPVALAAIAVYERIARQRVDPLAATIRHQAELAAEAAQGPEARQGRQNRSRPYGWDQPTGGLRA